MSESKCYRGGSCGPYEMLSCAECPASKPEYVKMNIAKNGVGRNMDKGQENNQCVMHNNICGELNELYRKKNHDYGDSYHKSFLKWGWPMAAIRLEDKLNRFETLITNFGEVKEESIRDTLMDLANYAILTVMELDAEKDNF